MKSDYKRGIISIIISAFGFACMSFFVKISGDVPVMQKAIFRNLVAAIVAAIIVVRSGYKIRIGKENRTALILRCVFGTLGLLCNFWVLQYLHMGDANILQKMAPFFSVIMSAVIIREKPDKISILMVIIALIGAGFVVKPGAGLVSFPALIGLFGGLCAGTAYTFVRKMGVNGVKGPVIVLCFSIASFSMTLPFVIFNFKPMTAYQTFCLFMAGISAAVGQFFVTGAYRFAPANEISVFDYTQVLFAAALGFFLLGEIPDIYSFIGYSIIIGAAIFKWNFSRASHVPKEASS